MTTFRRLVAVLSAVFFFNMCFSSPLFSEENREAEPYASEEFPLWLRNTRRTEIITLGSMPFTVLGVGLVYGAYNYFTGESSTFITPFNASSYSEKDIWNVVGLSFSVSLVIGLTDLAITLVKQKKQRDYSSKAQEAIDKITITTAEPIYDYEE